ncbi:LysM peptidoglycan-binding domain-containing protein [Pedobacter xixiisoli]|uniref:Membrane-bound lytic murein transglycosylase D n=1 Tax=Pedobacter xixiisoli TaxID=1476464 RepID=A0A286AEQ6_9SPHI|nr:LysM peptidoglycan-binding domain-containing protein [Pedobacter xixiisoli]SOD20383.1 membrane-bound lytic murein transglycosylase D [Pedobacter xixiisoli]
MRKLILTILSFVVILSAQAQIPVKVIQSDTILKRLTTALPSDTVAMPVIEQPLLFGQSLLYKLRLDSIKQTVPLDYNEYVQSYIDIYTKRKSMYGDMLGLSSYYFPIFEKALKSYNIPTEIKYLAIVESSLNPHAVSRVGATGIWQFMFGTAKAYGLNMDNFVDERKDPIQASYAAAAYFRDAYEELGDWLLAIAAYNCGKGNVNRAIDKAGSRDFWEIRKFLPKETSNYVPAFIAAVYVMKYAKNHQITIKPNNFAFKTDTVLVKNFVALNDVALAINHKEETLLALNPSYKKKIVNGTDLLPKRIVIPKPELQFYEPLFEVLNNDVEMDKQIFLASTDDVRDLRKKMLPKKQAASKILLHKVLPGQSLNAIANKYGVEVQDLKVWNELKVSTIVPGQRLKVYRDTVVAKFTPKAKVSFANYKVKQGDTLSSIAEKFDGITVASLKAANGLKSAKITEGMVLKVM